MSSPTPELSGKAPTTLEPREAGKLLLGRIKDPNAPHTVADVATESGLALRDAERGLAWLTSEYRGHLRATESGELLYLFPTGFTQPWVTKDRWDRITSRTARGLVGLGRFIVRAWLMIVLLAYVAIFVAVLVASMFAGSRNDNRRGGDVSGLGYVLFRVLADAFFWTFHPFSPFNAYGVYGQSYGGVPIRRARGQKDEIPFYEKVNRFFFGPTLPPPDPRAREKAILAELRAKKGRIGLADVMRVTGASRAEADPLMARLMLDYDGDVAVSDDGGIIYRFEEMRRTAEESQAQPPPQKPIWETGSPLPPLTGNTFETNVLISALNFFNLIMSLMAFEKNLTIAKLPFLFSRIPVERLPYDGTPILLGIVPLVFSIALFVLPIGRALYRPLKERKATAEKGRLAVLREVLTRVESKREVTDGALEAAWKKATGGPPAPGELSKRVAELGADVKVEEGGVRYRFADLETEAAALESEREAASAEEAKVGRVVFASDD